MPRPPVTSITDSPPKPLSVLPEGIPDPLKRYPCWVNWRYAFDGKKWTKHPYNPRSGRMASSTDLLTWSTFEEVLKAYEAGRYAGVGFMFSSGDPFCGVDLDGCRDPETGRLVGLAREIVAGLDSYAELSPSGRGVHVIVRGKVPTSLKLPWMEMYGMERYFTVTGRALEDAA